MTIMEEKFNIFLENQELEIKSLKEQLDRLSVSTTQVNLLADKVQKYTTEQIFVLNKRLEIEEDLSQIIRDMGQVILDLNTIVKLDARGLGLSVNTLVSKINEKQANLNSVLLLKDEIKEKEQRMKEAAEKIERGETRKIGQRAEKLADIRKYVETEQE